MKSSKPPVVSKANFIGLVKANNHPNEKIALMILTVVSKDHQNCINDRHKIYAAINTGATSTLCSHNSC